MKQKSKFKKKYWVYWGILILIVGFGVLFNKKIISWWHESQVDQDCIEEKINKYNNFVEGEIVITFHSNITELQTKKLIESYGLYILKVTGVENIRLRVQVPRNDELKWLCILERESDMIATVSPNFYIKAS